MFLIFSSIGSPLLYLVIFYFSPTLLLVTIIFNPIIGWIISLFIEETEIKTLDIVLKSIGYSLLLFSSLIYNEILICNFFGLNRNTKKYIEIRQQEENEELFLIMNKNEKDENDGLNELKNEKN